MSNEEVVDDSHRRFVYSPAKEWEIITVKEQWEGTIHSTWTFDATASLNFTGSQIKVYITVPAGVGTSAVDFSLDGLNGERRSQTSNATALYNFEFFDSGTLDEGDHNIVMTNKGEDNDMDFQLDRVVIMRGSASPPAGASSIVVMPSAPLPSTILPGTPSHTEAVIVEKKGSDTPVIAGSAVAGVVALSIIGALLFFYTHRRRHQKRAKNTPVSEENPALQRSSSGQMVVPYTTQPTGFNDSPHPSSTFAVKDISDPARTAGGNSNRTRFIEGLSMSSDSSTLLLRSSASRLVTSVSNTEDVDDHERPPSYVPDTVARQ